MARFRLKFDTFSNCLPQRATYSPSHLAWAFVLVSGLSVVIIIGFAKYTNQKYPQPLDRKLFTNKGSLIARPSQSKLSYNTNTSTPKLAADPVLKEAVPKSSKHVEEVRSGESCKLWNNSVNWDLLVRPTIQLDTTKFLYPGLIWGPNNQVVGLWQSVYLAIRLNRTIVLPTFYAHFSTGSGEIPATQRIDVERLRGFVSVVPIHFFHGRCNGSFDVVLQAMAIQSSNLKSFEKATGMSILHIKDGRIGKEKGSTALRLTDAKAPDPPPNIPAYPPDTYKLTYDPWITGDRSSLRKAYNTSASCALYSGPFNTIRVVVPNGVTKPLGNRHHSSAADGEILSAVMDAVGRPAAIVEAAKMFREDVFNGESYVAVHWRYDMQDWGVSRCRTDNQNKYSKMCEELRKITPGDVASGIATSLDQANINRTLWRYLYISSPPVLSEFSDNVVKAMQKINKNVKEAKMTLEAFLIQRHQTCWEKAGWKNGKEIFALIEMEVLSKCEWLFFAPGSTFSSNVRPTRWEIFRGSTRKKYETSIYEAARNAMISRIKAQPSV